MKAESVAKWLLALCWLHCAYAMDRSYRQLHKESDPPPGHHIANGEAYPINDSISPEDPLAPHRKSRAAPPRTPASNMWKRLPMYTTHASISKCGINYRVPYRPYIPDRQIGTTRNGNASGWWDVRVIHPLTVEYYRLERHNRPMSASNRC